MFRLQVLLEERFDELAEIATREIGKHVEESTAEIRRGIEVVELAASMTTLMKGETLDQVSAGVDVALYGESLGVLTASSSTPNARGSSSGGSKSQEPIVEGDRANNARRIVA